MKSFLKGVLTIGCILPVALFFIPLPLAVPIGIAGMCYDEHNWWPLALYLLWVIAGLVGMKIDDNIKWMGQ